MHRLKILCAAGSAAVLMATIAIVGAPSAEAAYTNGPPPEECTFCAAREESCRIGSRSGWRTCYYRMSGPGSCPACTPCVGSGLIDPWE